MGLFSKDDSGLKRVTVYWGSDTYAHVVTRPMRKEEINKLIEKISDPALLQRIKRYMKKHEIAQEQFSGRMPKITTQAQFEEFVSKEFSSNAEAALINTSLMSYLVIAEKK